MPKKKETKEVVEKSKASVLDIALKAINKKHGAAIRWLDDVPKENISYISTGSMSLDSALGGHGFPRGRVVEIFGWESCGKSTLAMSTAAEANKLGLNCLYIDAERALDPRLPVSYGVDPKKFILEDAALPAETHLDILESAVSSGDVGMVVVDSVTALTPKAILEGSYGDTTIGLQARLLSQSLSKLIHLIGETNTLLIFINQFREKINMYGGDPKTTSGGNAIRFYATHRVEIAGSGKTKSDRILGSDGNIVGHRMKFKVVKNKLGVPFRSGGIDLIYGKGYDTTSELVELAVDFGIIDVAGSWYSFGEENRFQGKDGFKKFVAENGEARNTIAQKVNFVLSSII